MKNRQRLITQPLVACFSHIRRDLLTLAATMMPIYCFASDTDFNLQKAADGVYVHQGKHLAVDAEGHDDIANIGFIIGETCVAVIDTGGSVSVGKQLLESIRSISNKPVCYVINTHVHFDHILGNDAFKNEHPEFVGHHQLQEAIEQNRDFFLTNFKNELGENATLDSIIAPTLLVEDTMTLDLGGRELRLLGFPVSHSHNDLVVIDSLTKILWAGDLIFRERIPSLTGSLRGWVETMHKLRELDVTKVIPGHGSIADSMESALRQQHGYLTRLLKETRKAVAEGQFVNDVMETIDRDNKSHWTLHDHQHAGNVSRAYHELEWE